MRLLIFSGVKIPRKPKRPCSHPGCPELVMDDSVRNMKKNTIRTMKNINETLKLISDM